MKELGNSGQSGETPKRKVISVHPRDAANIKRFDYGVKPITPEEWKYAFDHEPACHHAPHAGERRQISSAIYQMEKFANGELPPEEYNAS